MVFEFKYKVFISVIIICIGLFLIAYIFHVHFQKTFSDIFEKYKSSQYPSINVSTYAVLTVNLIISNLVNNLTMEISVDMVTGNYRINVHIRG